jgi:hypothetical protein
MVTLHTCQIDINKRLAPHFLHTSLAHSLMRQVAFTRWREEKKSGTSLEEDFLYWFELSLEHCIKPFMIRKFLLGFLPLEGFPG